MSSFRACSTVALALGAAACSTTTDPYECASRLVFSTLCHHDVDIATQQLWTQDYSAEAAALDAENLKAYQAKERAAGLESEAAALRGELLQQSAEMTGYQNLLDERRRQNRITQATYDDLTAQLTAVQLQIDEFRNKAYTAPEDLQRTRAVISTQVARTKRSVQQARIS